MRLTYDRKLKHFIARVNDTIVERTVFESHPKWTKLDRRSFNTNDFFEARKLFEFADAPTKKLLLRAFVRHYTFNGKLPELLDAHQVEGVKWVMTRSRSYLAHAPGAGKTVEAITCALYTPGAGPSVFIVPPSLTVNWENETYKFARLIFPGILPVIAIVPTSAKQSDMNWGAQFIIVPDSMLAKDWVLKELLALDIKFLAVDEASRFKEVTSTRTVALFGGVKDKFKSPGLIYKPRHVVLLDGSPMPNRSIELWAPTFAMCPEAIDFMSEKQFAFAYCDPKQNARGEWEFKGSTRSEGLRARLQKFFMHVVTEDKLGHSPRLRSIVFIADNRTPDVKAWEKKSVSIIRSRGEMEFLNDVLATMRKASGLSMVEPSVRYIKERLESGEAVLVFAWHREVVLKLAQALEKYQPGVIMGGTHKDDREASLSNFQGGKLNLLILNIAAGGRGHNIQRADRIIFVEPSWSDEQNKQCEKRASRRGRRADLPVKSDYLVVKGSVNELVLSSAFTKEKRVKDVVG